MSLAIWSRFLFLLPLLAGSFSQIVLANQPPFHGFELPFDEVLQESAPLLGSEARKIVLSPPPRRFLTKSKVPLGICLLTLTAGGLAHFAVTSNLSDAKRTIYKLTGSLQLVNKELGYKEAELARAVTDKEGAIKGAKILEGELKEKIENLNRERIQLGGQLDLALQQLEEQKEALTAQNDAKQKEISEKLTHERAGFRELLNKNLEGNERYHKKLLDLDENLVCLSFLAEGFAYFEAAELLPPSNEKNQKYDLAIARYSEANSFYRSMEAYYYRGLAFQKKGEPLRAISDFSVALSATDRSPFPLLYFKRAIAYFTVKDWDLAISDFTSAIKESSTYPNYFPAGNSSSKKRPAIDYYIAQTDKAMESRPILRALQCRAYCYLEKKEYDLAIDDFTQVLRQNPNNANAFYGRATAYVRQGFPQRARPDLAQAERLFGYKVAYPRVN
jgi:tetratricopeptide (TPR) repeat protein